jgi:antitoxin component of MazEF toxin-antitoxin module
MVTATVRRVGNRLEVTLPEDEAARLGIGEGDLVSLEVRRLDVGTRPVLPRDVAESLGRVLARPGMRAALGASPTADGAARGAAP